MIKRTVLVLIVILFSYSAEASVSGKCSFYHEKVTGQIEEAKACEADDDCVVIWPSCSFGCVVTVNKNSADKISKDVEDYLYSCGICKGFTKGCEECDGKVCRVSTPDFKCVLNKCTVEGETTITRKPN